jgi:hypothetical protein
MGYLPYLLLYFSITHVNNQVPEYKGGNFFAELQLPEIIFAINYWHLSQNMLLYV